MLGGAHAFSKINVIPSPGLGPGGREVAGSKYYLNKNKNKIQICDVNNPIVTFTSRGS